MADLAAFEAVAIIEIGADSVTSVLNVPVRDDTQAVMLRVTPLLSHHGACFQLEQVTHGTEVWVPPPSTRADFGPFCLNCIQRVSVGHGYGLFLLPNNGNALTPDTNLQVQVGLRDCTTFLPVPQVEESAPSITIAVESLRVPQVDSLAQGRLDLEFVFTQESEFFGLTDPFSHPVLGGAMASVASAFETIGVEIRHSRPRSLPDPIPEPLTFSWGHYGELDHVFQLALGSATRGTPDSVGTTILVIFAGCLMREDLQGGVFEPEGFVPHVPGGFSNGEAADAVFVKGHGCQLNAPRQFWFATFLAKILTHELGHYLGLYHTVEEDGTEDHIADTEEDNIMYFRPSIDFAEGFSRAQVRVLRSHPYIQYPGASR